MSAAPSSNSANGAVTTNANQEGACVRVTMTQDHVATNAHALPVIDANAPQLHAVVAVEACRVDPLPFEVGDFVIVAERVSANVWRGRVHGNEGTFLARLVGPIDFAPWSALLAAGGAPSAAVSSTSADSAAPAPAVPISSAPTSLSARAKALAARKGSDLPSIGPPPRSGSNSSASSSTTTSTASSLLSQSSPAGVGQQLSAADKRKSVFLLPARAGQSETEFKHSMVANELLQTESSFVADLELLQSEFLEPMLALSFVAESHLPRLSSIVGQLLPLHKTLLFGLDQAMRGYPALSLARPLNSISGGVFLSLYKEYCSTYEDVHEQLKQMTKKHQKLRKIAEDPARLKRTRNLRIEDFLIKPVQRLCKYPLLVKELLRCSVEADEQEQLQVALKKLSDAVESVNEHKRQQEGDNFLQQYTEAMALLRVKPPQVEQALGVLIVLAAQRPTDCATHYAIACALSLQDDVKGALLHAGRALQCGYGNIMHMAQDEALAGARSHPDWPKLFLQKLDVYGTDESADAYIDAMRQMATGGQQGGRSLGRRALARIKNAIFSDNEESDGDDSDASSSFESDGSASADEHDRTSANDDRSSRSSGMSGTLRVASPPPRLAADSTANKITSTNNPNLIRTAAVTYRERQRLSTGGQDLAVALSLELQTNEATKSKMRSTLEEQLKKAKPATPLARPGLTASLPTGTPPNKSATTLKAGGATATPSTAPRALPGMHGSMVQLRPTRAAAAAAAANNNNSPLPGRLPPPARGAGIAALPPGRQPVQPPVGGRAPLTPNRPNPPLGTTQRTSQVMLAASPTPVTDIKPTAAAAAPAAVAAAAAPRTPQAVQEVAADGVSKVAPTDAPLSPKPGEVGAVVAAAAAAPAPAPKRPLPVPVRSASAVEKQSTAAALDAALVSAPLSGRENSPRAAIPPVDVAATATTTTTAAAAVAVPPIPVRQVSPRAIAASSDRVSSPSPLALSPLALAAERNRAAQAAARPASPGRPTSPTPSESSVASTASVASVKSEPVAVSERSSSVTERSTSLASPKAAEPSERATSLASPKAAEQPSSVASLASPKATEPAASERPARPMSPKPEPPSGERPATLASPKSDRPISSPPPKWDAPPIAARPHAVTVVDRASTSALTPQRLPPNAAKVLSPRGHKERSTTLPTSALLANMKQAAAMVGDAPATTPPEATTPPAPLPTTPSPAAIALMRKESQAIVDDDDEGAIGSDLSGRDKEERRKHRRERRKQRSSVGVVSDAPPIPAEDSALPPAIPPMPFALPAGAKPPPPSGAPPTQAERDAQYEATVALVRAESLRANRENKSLMAIVRTVDRMRRERVGLLADFVQLESSFAGRPKSKDELKAITVLALQLQEVTAEVERLRAKLPPHLAALVPPLELADVASDDDDDGGDGNAARSSHRSHRAPGSRHRKKRRHHKKKDGEESGDEAAPPAAATTPATTGSKVVSPKAMPRGSQVERRSRRSLRTTAAAAGATADDAKAANKKTEPVAAAAVDVPKSPTPAAAATEVPKPAPKTEAKAEVKAETKPEVKSEVKVESKPETKPVVDDDDNDDVTEEIDTAASVEQPTKASDDENSGEDEPNAAADGEDDDDDNDDDDDDDDDDESGDDVPLRLSERQQELLRGSSRRPQTLEKSESGSSQ